MRIVVSFKPIRKSLRSSEAEIESSASRRPKIGFWGLSRKLKDLELKFVHNANINMPIAVSLSPSGSLYGLQKPI